MKKNRLIPLLGLFSMTIPFACVFPSLENVKAEEETESIHYQEEIDEEDSRTTRYYYDYQPVKVDEHFKAPGGCVLKLSSTLQLMDVVTQEVLKLPDAENTSQLNMLDIVAYRKIGDAGIYSQSDCYWDIGLDTLSDFLCNKLSTLVLYELEEKTVDFDISGQVEFQFYFSSYTYFFKFDIAPYEVKAYKDGDLVSGYIFEYNAPNDSRFNLRAEINEDLFNETYGFKTDGRELNWGNWDEKYTVSYFEKETNTILETNTNGEGIEINPIPNKPIEVFIRLSFFSEGKLYEFFSETISIEEKIPDLFLDGYNNRNVIGANKEHTLGIEPKLTYEQIDYFKYEAYIGPKEKEQTAEPEQKPTNLITSRVFSLYPSVFDNEESYVERFLLLTNDFLNFPIQISDVGDYEIYLYFNINGKCLYYYSTDVWHKTIHVVRENEEPIYTPIDDAFTLSAPEEITCAVGGEPIDIFASFANDLLNRDEEPIYDWTVSRSNLLDIKVDSNKAVIEPIGCGEADLTVSCTTKVVGTITKNIAIKIININPENSSLSIPDEFHYSHKDLTVGLAINNEENVLNLKLDWKVVYLNGDGEEVKASFIDNGDRTITLTNPDEHDYIITCSFNGVKLCTSTVEVRDINWNLFIRQNIWWIVLLTLGFMAGVIAVKVILDKKHSLVEMISKTIKKFTDIDENRTNDAIKQLQKVKGMIQFDISHAKDLNMDALNQYEKTIRYLTKSLNGIKAVTKKGNSISDEDFVNAYGKIKKDLEKSFIVAKEFEDARDIAISNAYYANKNNYAKIEKERKKKK